MSEMLSGLGETVGALLKRTRESHGLSIEEVGYALKLHPRQLYAIEADDFEGLGGSTFVRGFVRNYAKCLGLDDAAVIGMLEGQIALPKAELHVVENVNVVMPREGRRRPVAWLGAFAPLVVVALGAVAYYAGWLEVGVLRPQLDSMTSERASVGKPVPTASEEPVPIVVPAAPANAVPVDTSPSLPISSAQASEPAGLNSPSGGSETHRLFFRFDRLSWVEVKDAAGRILLSQLNRPGTTQVVDGSPPFALVVGNASGVQLRYEEHEVDLRPHTRVEVARLVLE